MWFPRPGSEDDLIALEGVQPPSRRVLFALLRAPDAEEWRDKVGVAGAREGSGKPTTRLLASGEWVFKTDASLAEDEPDGLRERAAAAAAQARRVPLWHPDKTWIVLRAGGRFHLVSACPRLEVLRALPTFEARVGAWGRMLAFALRASREHGAGLDIHPSNFGTRDGALYYLDDELYPPSWIAELGRAIADRIPEEEAPVERWRWAGARLSAAISPLLRSVREHSELIAGLTDRPLLPRFTPARDAVVEALSRAAHAARPRGEARTRTCLFADVHANLPALDAVLDAGGALGAERWLFLGDAVGYGPHPAECVDMLASLDGLAAVRGNHDHVVARARPDEGMSRMARFVVDWTAERLDAPRRAWLGALPRELRGEGWLAVHGAPRDPERLYAYVYELTFRENLEVLRAQALGTCFHGHTHVPFVHRRNPDGSVEKLGATTVALGLEGAQLLVNPGSVGQPRDGDPRASFAIWERPGDTITFHRAGYAIEATVADMRRAGFPPDLGYRLETGR